MKSNLKETIEIYIAGDTLENRMFVDCIKKILSKRFKNKYRVKVVDIKKNAEKIEKENILAVPTIIKKGSGYSQRIIGKFKNEETFIIGLGL